MITGTSTRASHIGCYVCCEEGSSVDMYIKMMHLYVCVQHTEQFQILGTYSGSSQGKVPGQWSTVSFRAASKNALLSLSGLCEASTQAQKT